MTFIRDYLATSLLIIGSIYLIFQEDFLVEKVPFVFFYSCKLSAKTLGVRSRFEIKSVLNHYLFLWLICFGKKIVIDIAYYHINWLRYVRYSTVLLVIDFLLNRIDLKGVSANALLKIRPLKAFLLLASGISDAISLENLLWRNHLNGFHLDVAVFFFVVLDPLLYTIFAWFFKGQQKEKNFSVCQRNLNFGVFLALAHYAFSLENYSSLLELRRIIPLHSSNVLTPAVGMRLLNCLAYVLFGSFTIITEMIKSDEKSNNKFEKNYKVFIEELACESRQNPIFTTARSRLDQILLPVQNRKID